MLPAVSFTFVDGQAIFLDLANDHYVAAGVASSAALERICTGAELSERDSWMLRPLIERGLLPVGHDRIRAQLCEPCAVVETSWLDTLPSRVWMPAVRSAARIVSAGSRLRAQPLCEVVLQIQQRKATLVPRESQLLPCHRLTAHYWSGMFLPAHGRCLARSVALVGELLATGFACDLVIGVMRNPFKAHCWAQAGTTVLNDSLDEVRAFKPILVI